LVNYPCELAHLIKNNAFCMLGFELRIPYYFTLRGNQKKDLLIGGLLFVQLSLLEGERITENDIWNLQGGSIPKGYLFDEDHLILL